MYAIDSEDEIYKKAPLNEPDRQNYFIDKCREIILNREQEYSRKLTYHVATFGCQMNARDSEKLSGILEIIGYIYEEDEKLADFVIYNTCTVRDNANQRLYGRLGTLCGIKKKNKNKMIGICGCMMQEDTCVDKIKESYSNTDIVFGTHNVYKLAEILYLRLISPKKKMIIEILDKADTVVEDLPVKRNYTFKSGVNIMYGCDNFCTYCIVPYVRGRERSRSSEEIICEIKKLRDQGVKEIMLLGQNVNSYGKGIEGEITFPELLKKCEEIDGIERIRFMTPHPKDLSDDLIQVIKNSSKICHHIHLPLQSGSSAILNKMNRRYTKESYIALAKKIKKEISDVSITTDIIVGFPGEKPEDVDDTIDVINQVEFDGAFTFIYSKRTGTPAASFEGQFTEDEVKPFFDKVLKAVQENSQKRAKRFEGQIMDVLVEDINRQDESLVTGRLANNLLVHFPGDSSLIGEIVPVKLSKCMGFYYLGERDI